MNKSIQVLIITFLLICKIGEAQNDNYSNEVDSIKVDNIFRSYEAYIPSHVVKQPKLIFVLHGSTMTTEQMLKVTGNQFNSELNPSKNRIVVYPQGFEKLLE